MTHMMFQVTYRLPEDGRRSHQFFEAEDTGTGWGVYFPPEFVAQLRSVEAVHLIDVDTLRLDPTLQAPLSAEDIAILEEIAAQYGLSAAPKQDTTP